jgi:hypothetical protein
MRRGTSFPNKQARREGALERQEAYDKLTAAQKVEIAGLKQLKKMAAKKKDKEVSELATARLSEEEESL